METSGWVAAGRVPDRLLAWPAGTRRALTGDGSMSIRKPTEAGGPRRFGRQPSVQDGLDMVGPTVAHPGQNGGTARPEPTVTLVIPAKNEARNLPACWPPCPRVSTR